MIGWCHRGLLMLYFLAGSGGSWLASTRRRASVALLEASAAISAVKEKIRTTSSTPTTSILSARGSSESESEKIVKPSHGFSPLPENIVLSVTDMDMDAFFAEEPRYV